MFMISIVFLCRCSLFLLAKFMIVIVSLHRCSVFLLERDTDELVAKVFDGDIRNGKEVKQVEFVCIFDVRILS